jgi:hypothetical protein
VNKNIAGTGNPNKNDSIKKIKGTKIKGTG